MNKDEDIVEKVCRIISKIVLILFLLVFIRLIFPIYKNNKQNGTTGC